MEEYQSIEGFIAHMREFFTNENIQDNTSAYVSIEKPFVCTNHNESIRTFRAEFAYHRCRDTDAKYELHIDYNVLKCSYDHDETHSFYDLHSVEECVHQLFAFLWEFDLCKECLCMTNKDQKLCRSCLSSRLMWEWGVKNGKVSVIEKCAICLEEVYCSKLACGHQFHKTCFINLNPLEWFDEDVNVKCPICRKDISDRDKSVYFKHQDS